MSILRTTSLPIVVFAVASNDTYVLSAIAALRTVLLSNPAGAVRCFVVGNLHPSWVSLVQRAGLNHLHFHAPYFRRVERYPAEVVRCITTPLTRRRK